MNKRTDGISHYSTGLHPLSGPLPKKPRRSCLKDLFLEKGQSGSYIFLSLSMGDENSFFGESSFLTPHIVVTKRARATGIGLFDRIFFVDAVLFFIFQNPTRNSQTKLLNSSAFSTRHVSGGWR